jgi:hypothetical protein
MRVEESTAQGGRRCKATRGWQMSGMFNLGCELKRWPRFFQRGNQINSK